jgi:hypothetical protein
MLVTDSVILVYKGHKGELYEIVGGSDGHINLKRLDE